VIYSNQPKTNLKINRSSLKKLILKIIELAKTELPCGSSISVNFVNTFTISSINEKYVGHTGVTDVISFDYRDGCEDEDDVAIELFIYPYKAYEESIKRSNISFAQELTLYIIHGILHMSGHDDIDKKDRIKMRERERYIINNIKNEFVLSNIFMFNEYTNN